MAGDLRGLRLPLPAPKVYLVFQVEVVARLPTAPLLGQLAPLRCAAGSQDTDRILTGMATAWAARTKPGSLRLGRRRM